jgi:hypothetical protein
MKGQRVCPYHGGNAPLAKAKARERLDQLALPSVGVLHKAVRKVRKGGTTDDMKVALRAAQLVLDRTGFAAKSEIELSGGVKVESTINVASLPLWLKMSIIVSLAGHSLGPDLEKVIMEKIEPLFLSIDPETVESFGKKPEPEYSEVEDDYGDEYDSYGDEYWDEDETEDEAAVRNSKSNSNHKRNSKGKGRSNGNGRRSTLTFDPDEI